MSKDPMTNMQRNGLLMLGLLWWLLSGCDGLVSESNEALRRLDSLNYELILEQRLNDQLQDYIEEVCYPRVEPNLRRTALGVPTAQPRAEADSLGMPRLELRVVGRGQSYRIDRAFRFAPSSVTLSEAAQTLLSQVADSLRNRPGLLITAVGHCDNLERGDTLQMADAWELSSHRASAVVRYLISQGISPHLLRVAGRSKFQPIASNHTRAGRDLNRRVELVLTRVVAEE
jgi:flagellar motor protein MotB